MYIYVSNSRKVAGSISSEVIAFFNLSNPYSRTTALVSTQSLRVISTSKRPEGKGLPARKAHLTAICEPIA
jgi:hypothetical protein